MTCLSSGWPGSANSLQKPSSRRSSLGERERLVSDRTPRNSFLLPYPEKSRETNGRRPSPLNAPRSIAEIDDWRQSVASTGTVWRRRDSSHARGRHRLRVQSLSPPPCPPA